MALSIASKHTTNYQHNTMRNSFLNTLLWSSSDDNGEPLDREYSISKIDNTEVIDRVICQFVSMVEEDPVLISLDNIEQVTGNDRDKIAHDLCLTINGHGAGFWDGDYSSDGIGSSIVGDRLTAIARSFTEIGLYESNNDRLTIERSQ